MHMKLKKIFTVLVSSICSIPLVFAKEMSYVPEPIERFLEFMFIRMERYAATGNDLFVIYAKFLLFIMLFAIFNFGATKIFKEKGKVAGVVGFILALLSTILIPKNMLIFIFNTYSTVIGFILALVPVFIGLYISYVSFKEDTFFNRLMKAIIMIMIAVVTFSFAGLVIHYEGGSTELYQKLGQWAGTGGAIAFILGIWYLIRCFGVGGAAETLREGVGTTLKKKEREREEEEEDEEKEVRLDKKEKRVLSKLIGVEKREIYEIDKIIVDLQKIKEIATKKNIADPRARERIIESIRSIIHSEEEFEGRYRQIIKAISDIGRLLEAEYYIENDAEKREIAAALGISKDKIVKKDKMLYEDAKDSIKKKFTLLRTRVIQEQNEIIQFERQFRVAFRGLQATLNAGLYDRVVEFIDQAIQAKEDQRNRFRVMLAAEKALRHLENRELKDAIQIIKNVTSSGPGPVH